MLSEELKNKINKKLQHIMYDLIYKDTADFFIEEIINIIENSNLIELPCKAGDKVYYIINNGIKCLLINSITILGCDNIVLNANYNENINVHIAGSWYNKYWFIDKSKAEQMLKELNHEN